MKLLILALLPLLFTSCSTDEANHRGFVISHTNEISPDSTEEQIQP